LTETVNTQSQGRLRAAIAQLAADLREAAAP
jgi:hypothetical protein